MIQGKPCFDWDKLSDEPATLDNKDAVALDNTRVEAPVPEKVTLPQIAMVETRGRPGGSVQAKGLRLPHNEHAGVPTTTGTLGTSKEVSTVPGIPNTSSKVENMPEFDIRYEAECILKQRNTKDGQREFLVRWADKSATDAWTKEEYLSDGLLFRWWRTHTRKGNLRKNSLVDAPGPWAYKRRWSSNSTESKEEVDQFGNEL